MSRETFWQLAARLSALINLPPPQGHCSADNPENLDSHFGVGGGGVKTGQSCLQQRLYMEGMNLRDSHERTPARVQLESQSVCVRLIFAILLFFVLSEKKKAD